MAPAHQAGPADPADRAARAAAAPRLRLFVALWPPPEVRDALDAIRVRWRWPAGTAPVAASKLHVTLHFLGDVAADRMPALQAALRAVEAVPFTWREARPAMWPHGLAVLELDAPAALRARHAAVGEALRAIGCRVEARPYRPHVTLARHAAGAEPPPAPLELHWPAADHVLVASGRGRYTVL